MADRIRESLRTPFEVEGFEGMPITVTASIGIATGDRNSALELLRDADIALYRAKAAGRDCAVLFEPAMQSAALDRLELKSDLGTALAAGQFFLLYQPIFDLHSVNLQGVEALLRWQHPTRGVIPPNDFIPVLEDYGMIVDVGRWVLDEACAQAARWQRQGHRITMSVNASMRQLETDSFVGDVKAALARNRLEPTSLVIEVTESTLMRDANTTVARLRRLKEIGVMLAIDDFGTGYSSLAYLRQFPVDVLKIDRSFVAEMDGSHDCGGSGPHARRTWQDPRTDHPCRRDRGRLAARDPSCRALRVRSGLLLLAAGGSHVHRGAPRPIAATHGAHSALTPPGASLPATRRRLRRLFTGVGVFGHPSQDGLVRLRQRPAVERWLRVVLDHELGRLACGSIEEDLE